MAWHDIYLLASLLTSGMAWLSGSHVSQKIALVLFFSCAACNGLAVVGMTPPALQVSNAVIDIIGMALVASLGRATHSRLGLAICGLYLGMMALHVFTVARTSDNIAIYKLFLNGLFAMQLIITGAWSSVQFVDRLRHHLGSVHHRRSDFQVGS